MVAIHFTGTKSRPARRRVPLVILFLCAFGLTLSYFLVLLAFALRGDSESTQKEGCSRIQQALESVSRKSSVGWHHKGQGRRSSGKTSVRGAMDAELADTPKLSRRDGTDAMSKGMKSDLLTKNVTNSALISGRGTRGRNNFRNVVIPNMPGREKGRKPGWMAKSYAEGVKPQTVAQAIRSDEQHQQTSGQHPSPEHILTAYVEPIDFQEWETKPLPPRSTATADQLEIITYPKLDSCKKLPEMIPADEYPDHDPFLPWIHDVFPTDDGKFIQFVAQNRRRCNTGSTVPEKQMLHLMQPSIALFQHVPVKRIHSRGNETRYRLSSHEEADLDGVATRFICRFKPSMEETLSVYNLDYDYASHRKRLRNTFQYKDGGILSVHLSQLIFRCPVPEALVETIQSGESVRNDWATIFVDVIPIRTPPRYGLSNDFLQPRYSDRLPTKVEDRFDPIREWGSNHTLPQIYDSGRWENIPICKPSLKEYYPIQKPPSDKQLTKDTVPHGSGTSVDEGSAGTAKRHRLVACLWASAGYTTRGNRFAVNDGQRRLLEWIHFNKLLGFNHFYLYDNSYAFSDTITLKPIADLFPNYVTYIKWPFQVCNNNPNNVDSPGERSSQYAAESSCRLRFGEHTDWIGQFDIDEYIIPMGHHTSLLPVLDKLDQEGTKILSFGSWRAWPRRDLISAPKPIQDPRLCNNQFTCFDLEVPVNRTILQTFNCERQSGPKKDVMPAEKQLYRPDYVLQHFIHYSSVTVLAQMSKSEFENAGYNWIKTRMIPDPHSRFADETKEATMLHAKAVARQDTAGWQDVCRVGSNLKKRAKCRIGTPFPDGYVDQKHGLWDEKNWTYNCYVNKKTEDYWVPLLGKALTDYEQIVAD